MLLSNWVKDTLFKRKPPPILIQISGWFPTRKEVGMNDFNISLFLILLILFILKNGSHCIK